MNPVEGRGKSGEREGWGRQRGGRGREKERGRRERERKKGKIEYGEEVDYKFRTGERRGKRGTRRR